MVQQGTITSIGLLLKRFFALVGILGRPQQTAVPTVAAYCGIKLWFKLWFLLWAPTVGSTVGPNCVGSRCGLKLWAPTAGPNCVGSRCGLKLWARDVWARDAREPQPATCKTKKPNLIEDQIGLNYFIHKKLIT